MSKLFFAFVVVATFLFNANVRSADEAKLAKKYFAHPVVEDHNGVIAPWYHGQNGQCDFRMRVAAETLKRYPWTEPGQAVTQAPHFIFNGHWNINSQGKIAVNTALSDWNNGDVGQRTASLLLGFTDYYRYSGDPAAFGIITMTADYVVDYCQTPADHPWPNFMISAPTKGKAYSRLTRAASSNWTLPHGSGREWLPPISSPATDAIGRPLNIGPIC